MISWRRTERKRWQKRADLDDIMEDNREGVDRRGRGLEMRSWRRTEQEMTGECEAWNEIMEEKNSGAGDDRRG